MSFLSRLFGKRPTPPEQFARDVIAEFEKSGIKPERFDDKQFLLVLPDDPRLWGLKMEVGLVNIFNASRELDATARQKLIERFVRGIVTPKKELNSLADAAAQLMPLVRSRGENSIALLQTINRLADNNDQWSEAPFVGDLVVQLGLDYPDNVVRITEKMLNQLGTTLTAALPVAIANLEKSVPPAHFSAEGIGVPGVYYSSNAEDYQSSLLLRPIETGMVLPTIDGEPVVMVPGRNQMFLTGSRNEAGLLSLARLGESSLRSTAHRCSVMLLHWTGGQWRPFEPIPGTPLAKQYERALLLERAHYYGEMKFALDRAYEKSGADIYVGEYMLLEKDGELHSASSWTKGVTHGVMPQVDRLFLSDLQIDPSTGQTRSETKPIGVPWDNAIPIVGHLLQPMPGMYPPLFEYKSFPSEAEWEAIKALSI